MSIDFRIEADWQPTIKWLKRIQKGTDDARPLWVALVPRIREFVKDEFSGANPSRWPALTPKYRHWKSRARYPPWIGVMTGTMRDAAGPGAVIELTKTRLTWKLDTSKALSDKGYPYSTVFHWGRKDGSQPPRHIFKATVARTNSLLKKDIKDLEGGSKAAFTFAWLSKAIDPYRV